MIYKCFRWAAVFALLLPMIWLVNAEGTEEPLIPDPDFDPSLGVDVPTWRVGDYWNYSTSFSVNYLGFSIPFSGWMNMSVEYVTLDFTHSDSPVYITNISGNVSGFLKISILGIDEKIYIDLSGYMWERIQDLAMYRMILNATVSGTQSSINGNYPLGYEYDPPLEQYDFPLITGEEWFVNVSASMPFGGSGQLVDLKQNMSCGWEVQKTVPAGSFMTLPVLVEDNPSLFYNQTVGNSVERIFELEVSGLSQTVPWKLDDYNHESEETRIRIWVESIEPVWAGSTFDIKGELSTGNTVITILFPGSQVAATIPLVGSTTSFTQTLTAPWEMDNTPTSFDHASFGIFAIVGMLEEYDVCTVTTKAFDLLVNSSSLSVEFEGEGTKDDNYTAILKIYNPSNYGISGVDIQLRFKEGEIVFNQTIPIIEAKGMFGREVDMGKVDPGNYTLVLEVDPQDLVEEYNETNNMVQLDLDVKDRLPLNQISSTPPGEIQANEGEWVNISAWSFRGEESIPTGNWTIDGVEKDWDNHINISLDYLGEISYREEPYVIIYNPDPTYLFPDENGTMQWDLTVINVNRPPELISFFPQMEIIEIEEDQSVNLSIQVIDHDGQSPIINWTTNGEGKWFSKNVPTVTFISSFTGENSSEGSPYVVKVVASDPEDHSLNVSIHWTVIVLDVDRLPLVNITPSPGDIEAKHNDTLSFELSLDDPDSDPVNATWYLDGVESWSGSNYDLSLGSLSITSEQYIALVLYLATGTFQQQYNWTIHVLPPSEPEEPEPVPPAGAVITSPEMGMKFLTNETITFKVEHIDARPLSFRWLINGTFLQGQQVAISDLSPGNYTAVVNITTEGPPPGWIELEVSFSVVAPDGGDVEEPEGKDDPFPWWIILVLIIGIVLVLALVLLLLSRKRDDEYEE